MASKSPCLAILLIGMGILMLGPQGWRTYIKGIVIGGVPLGAELLNYAQGIDLSKFNLTARLAAVVAIGSGQ